MFYLFSSVAPAYSAPSVGLPSRSCSMFALSAAPRHSVGFHTAHGGGVVSGKGAADVARVTPELKLSMLEFYLFSFAWVSGNGKIIARVRLRVFGFRSTSIHVCIRNGFLLVCRKWMRFLIGERGLFLRGDSAVFWFLPFFVIVRLFFLPLVFLLLKKYIYVLFNRAIVE